MVIRTGIIGHSEGNGHPFSFSAIVNGYDDARFAKAGWPVILDYLRNKPSESFGFSDARMTHAWTQDLEITKKLCDACHIETICTDVSQMLDAVDALIIARDDWESHFKLALPFLRAGIPVFVDKPLTLNESELKILMPFLQSGKLMSCSGLRYAVELDSIRKLNREIGKIKLVSGSILNGLEKYGIHLIEAIASFGGTFARPVAVTRLESPHDSFLIHFQDGVPFHLDCLGSVGKTFHISVYGDLTHRHYDLYDNFSAFRRTLENFYKMVRTKEPPIDPMETIHLIKLLIVARALKPGETKKIEFEK